MGYIGLPALAPAAAAVGAWLWLLDAIAAAGPEEGGGLLISTLWRALILACEVYSVPSKSSKGSPDVGSVATPVATTALVVAAVDEGGCESEGCVAPVVAAATDGVPTAVVVDVDADGGCNCACNCV